MSTNDTSGQGTSIQQAGWQWLKTTWRLERDHKGIHPEERAQIAEGRFHVLSQAPATTATEPANLDLTYTVTAGTATQPQTES